MVQRTIFVMVNYYYYYYYYYYITTLSQKLKQIKTIKSYVDIKLTHV